MSVVFALVIDAIFGDPARAWSRTGHPVTWFGSLIDWLDQALNWGGSRKAKGVVAIAAAILAFAIPVALLAGVLGILPGLLGSLAIGVVASSLIAHKSLNEHVARVADAGTIEEARTAVSMVVGRDVSTLDEAGVSRASLETLAESLSDGVVAPAFWLAIGGLPGLVAYKVVNTADSMIGHRTERHGAFGWAAARLDDAMNFVPARITAFLIALTAPRLFRLRERIIETAEMHVSPNAGWPEAALAYRLDVALGGPRSYEGERVDGVWLHPNGRTARFADIRRGIRVGNVAGAFQIVFYALIAILF
ncbi:adenosylcobinamide-phosphate synthase CbiB [Acuticoccus sp. M5D2P5]|uniref:adenosylcobinamide-phosphate synthase CbiB n=1 Tax=Acuticoccus kalidii TaxID=2910977 RepID=UPI001F41A839|nr:adenosylcobinamide-phosphate synthase CbiB [Acuticoccus kalidii]MCF3933188.1 adenosylcobinamide-phosphate synthase CbiB [Acuticoccus kalidii]